MASSNHSYKYKEQKEYADGLPLSRRIVQKIELINKFLTLGLLGKILRIKPILRPVPLKEVKSVLFIRYDALGDMIVTTPLWRILKQIKPSIKIGVAGSYKNIGVIQNDPDVDVIYDYSARSLFDFFQLTRPVRKQQWDVVIVCSFNQKTRNAIIARLSSPRGITATVGAINKQGHQKLFSRLVKLPTDITQMSMVSALQYLLLNTIDFGSEVQEQRPSINIDDTMLKNISSQTKDYLSSITKSKYILLNTDAPDFKKWGIENNFALAEYLLANFPEYGLLISGLSKNGDSIRQKISSMEHQGAHYIETLHVQEMVALVHYSSIVITPDTSIVHLASAEMKPIVAFYLAKNEWLPYITPYVVIIPQKGKPISTIPVDTVKESVSLLINSLANSTSEDIRHIVELQDES